MAALIGDHVVRTGFDSRFEHRIGGAGCCRIEDLADPGEHVGDGAGRAEITIVLGKDRADGAARPVAVVGQRLDDDGHATGAIALIPDLVVVLVGSA